MHLARFERATFGFVDRHSDDIRPDLAKTYDTLKMESTQELTHGSKSANFDVLKLPEDLVEIITVWEKLPDHIKQTVITLVGSVTVDSEDNK